MKTVIQLYDNLKQKVQFLFKQLKLIKQRNIKGRKLAMPITETVTMSVFKQLNGIATKKALYKIFKPNCSYKTLVVNINRFALWALLILTSLLKLNQRNSHVVKHTDSTDIPVCLKKNAKHHQTMKGLANWGTAGKGLFYGLKLHITTDLKRRMLSVRFSSGNVNDRKIFTNLNRDLFGIFVADAGYISKKLSQEFNIEGKRVLLAKPRVNMKKIATKFQNMLYDTRMIIELNFRNLKMFYGLITSLPRSVDGYLANYVYSLLAYQLA